MKRIIASVTNDLITDNRVHKICSTLTEMGFSVLLIGRKLPDSLPVKKRNYKTKRMYLFCKKGPFFYAEYNFRLLLVLLFNRFDVLLSNDLDTLSANFMAANFKNKQLVYDSHEYFTEVPELINRPGVKKIWKWLEKKMLPRVDQAYTVCDSIAKIYTEQYGIPFYVVRNIPGAQNIPVKENKRVSNEKMILYQGAVNTGRGLKEVILAMNFIENAKLVIAGDGDIKTELENLVQTEKLENKVVFTGRLPMEELEKLTPKADLGLSIEEDLGLNYRFALPNKLFNYIQARVPVLITDLPEMKAIVTKYNIGEITSSLEPKTLAAYINSALSNKEKRKTWFENLETASAELTWEKEQEIVKKIYSQFL